MEKTLPAATVAGYAAVAAEAGVIEGGDLGLENTYWRYNVDHVVRK